jgi:hypothetical protein
MALKIVWRNPLPLVRSNRTVQLIISNELGAVYAVTAPDLTQEFEVIPGGSCLNSDVRCLFQEGADAEDSEIIERASGLYAKRPTRGSQYPLLLLGE